MKTKNKPGTLTCSHMFRAGTLFQRFLWQRHRYGNMWPGAPRHPHNKGFIVTQGGRERVVKLTPELAADRVGKLMEQLRFVNLDAEETSAALRRAAALGVAGGRTHDFLHVAAAEKGRAEKILTCNGRDFVGLSEIALEDPSAKMAT